MLLLCPVSAEGALVNTIPPVGFVQTRLSLLSRLSMISPRTNLFLAQGTVFAKRVTLPTGKSSDGWLASPLSLGSPAALTAHSSVYERWV
jgi:hypothetical protein